MTSDLSPIVLFVYNRLTHTQKTIEALQKNTLAKDSILFIYSDGARNEEEKVQVQSVRKHLKTVDGFKHIEIIESSKNLGLAKSIISGVSDIVNKYGKIIVLEDDLITSKSFLVFMNKALDFYKKEEQVMHISGYIYPINSKYLNSTFFIKPASCWGWATWDTSWSYFKKNTQLYIGKFNEETIKDFNLSNNYNYYKQIAMNHSGELNTWAIFWYASCYFNNGLCLHPSVSYVQNIGHDDSGENCGSSSSFIIKQLNNTYNIDFGTNIVEDKKARYEIEIYFRRISSFSRKMKNVLTHFSNKLFSKK